MLQKIVWLAAAGALGALCRIGLSTAFQALGARFPWGTVSVNIVGCFLFGLIWAMTAGPRGLPPELRLFVLGGFLGAFTTFSSYIFDTLRLFHESGFVAACLYFLLQNAIGLLALMVGIALGKPGPLGSLP